VRIATVFSSGDHRADRVVPKIGMTSWLTVFVSAGMAFLAVFALALAFSTERVARSWTDDLARAATVRITGTAGSVDDTTATVVQMLQRTPGVTSARILSEAEQRRLLEPWIGGTLDLSQLPVPQLVEITIDTDTFDADGLRLYLSENHPGTALDDHARWRAPLIAVASRVRILGFGTLLLIGLVMAALVTLAARAALSANSRVIKVLRLIGARDAFVARAFVRRVTLRAMAGALLGVTIGLVAVALIPDAGSGTGLLAQFGFVGRQWLWPLALIPATGLIAVVATRAAARSALKRIA
jgi:cell division transport system permease protein